MKYIISVLILALLTTFSQADNYKKLDNSTYFNSLLQPDNNTSCCGEGDAYVVKTTEPCTEKDLQAVPSCRLVAILDKQPLSFQEYQKAQLPEGTRAVVPSSKIRKVPSANPTGYDIIFLYVFPTSVGTICWEPAFRS